MCGIVGCVGKIWAKEEDAFKLLLQLDTIRGPHSTGVLKVVGNDNVKEKWGYLKTVGTPWDLFKDKSWSNLMKGTNRVLLGHNRWATVGAITSDNAHPFAHGSFIGVHNGTLRNRVNLKDGYKFGVDSESIFYNLDQVGVEETIKKLEGAFALVWYNERDNLLQMVRNQERPLWLCKTEEGKTYFWASEPWMLKVALAKHDIKHTDPVELEVGKLMSFTVPGTDVTDEAMKGFIPRVKSVELYKAPDTYSTTVYGGNYNYASRYDSRVRDSREVRRDNVIPFSGKQGIGSRILKDFVGKSVVFSVVGEKCTHNMNYILCEIDETGPICPDIRIFVSSKTNLGKMLLSSVKMFKAKVKGYTSKQEFGEYLTVDHRTIEEVDIPQLPYFGDADEEIVKEHEDESPGLYYPGYKNSRLEVNEWYRRTSRGCSWCSDMPELSDADKLHWHGERDFVCEKCFDEPIVAEMIRGD